jgi:acetyltransferase-like isoleucine patch superfamily enzyme
MGSIVLYLKQWAHGFLYYFVLNDCLPLIPFWGIRKLFLRFIGMKIGKGSFIMKNTYFMGPKNFSMGKCSHINRGCFVDARGTLKIGDNVSISHNVNIVSGGHDFQSESFALRHKPIYIDDYVWVGVGATILQGVHIGKGAVVCAGAVVSKDVGDFDVVAGVPAKKIKERTHNLNYQCKWDIPLT